MAESKVCVSCLSSEMIFNIFDTHECEGNEEIYAEMLKFCLDITISDESPAKYMCEKCILLLREIYIFKQDILRNVKDFEAEETIELIDSASIASSQDTETFGTVVYCMELDGTNATPDKSCLTTDDIKVKKFVVKDEKSIKDDNIKLVYEDDVLNTSNKKYKATKKVKVESKVEKNESNSEGVFACDQCPKQFNSKLALQRHARTHLSGPFVCRLCDKVFAKMNTRNAHLWRVHTMQPFRCPKCPKRFRTLHRRLAHLLEAHNIRPEYKCAQCEKVFPDTSSRWQHVRMYHERVRNHKCESCAMAFFKRRDLLNHMASVHDIGEKSHVCDVCGKSFYLLGALQKHMKRHVKTEDEIYKCLECPAGFKYQEDMKEYCKTHQKYKTEITNDNEIEEGTVIVDHGEYSNDTVYFDITDTGLLTNTVDFSL